MASLSKSQQAVFAVEHWLRNTHQDKFDEFNYDSKTIREIAVIVAENSTSDGDCKCYIELTDKCAMIMNVNKLDIIACVENNNKPNYSIIIPKQEETRLSREIGKFAGMHKEDILYNHNAYDRYMLLTVDELITELKTIQSQCKCDNQLTLRDCNIRVLERKDKKYYRITFTTNEPVTTVSRVEAIFGHHINGFTYIFKADVFKKNKDLILSVVNYEETEFGKNTRWDMNGVVYDKKQNKKSNKKKNKKGKK